jgi:hypothetical protein
MAKIAPTLSYLAETERLLGRGGAAAELRALLAVVRAAWRVEGLNGGAANDALTRALARLDRISKEDSNG